SETARPRQSVSTSASGFKIIAVTSKRHWSDAANQRLSAERWHDFFGEKTHGFEDLAVRNAAEIEGRGKRVEGVVLHGVMNISDALVGGAVIVAARCEH